MRILIDTHIVLWSLCAPHKLNPQQYAMLNNIDNQIFVSSISVAELMIKCSIGKLTIQGDLVTLIIQAGFEFLAYTEQDAQRLRDLPLIHRDPFDRMLLTQCQNNQYVLMSNDAIMRQYNCQIVG